MMTESPLKRACAEGRDHEARIREFLMVPELRDFSPQALDLTRPPVPNLASLRVRCLGAAGCTAVPADSAIANDAVRIWIIARRAHSLILW